MYFDFSKLKDSSSNYALKIRLSLIVMTILYPKMKTLEKYANGL